MSINRSRTTVYVLAAGLAAAAAHAQPLPPAAPAAAGFSSEGLARLDRSLQRCSAVGVTSGPTDIRPAGVRPAGVGPAGCTGRLFVLE